MSRDDDRPEFTRPFGTDTSSEDKVNTDTPYETEESLAEETTHYDELGIDKDAPAEEVKKKFRKLSSKYHPDLHVDKRKKEFFSQKQSRINEIKDILLDEEKRAHYDVFGNDNNNQLSKKDEDVSFEEYYDSLREKKKALRKYYRDLLTDFRTNQYVTLAVVPGHENGPVFVMSLESNNRFSIPVTSYDTIRISSVNQLSRRRTTQMSKTLQWRHYFPQKNTPLGTEKKKKSYTRPCYSSSSSSRSSRHSSRSYVSAEVKSQLSSGFCILEAQSVLSEKRQWVVKASFVSLCFPFWKFMGPELHMKRLLWNGMEGYVNATFPVHRRNVYIGLKSRERRAEVRLVCEENVVKVVADYDFWVDEKEEEEEEEKEKESQRESQAKKKKKSGRLGRMCSGIGKWVSGLSGLIDFSYFFRLSGEYWMIRSEEETSGVRKSLHHVSGDVLCLVPLKGGDSSKGVGLKDGNSSIGFGLGVNSSTGIGVRAYFRRDKHHLSVPVLLGPLGIQNLVFGVACPLFLCLAGYKLYCRYGEWNRIKRNEKEREEGRPRKSKEEMEEAVRAYGKEMRRIVPVARSVREQKKKKGLYIVKASYGVLKKNNKKLLDENEVKKFQIDVTDAMQVLVRNDEIELKGGVSKSVLEGFYDPCIFFIGPKKKKDEEKKQLFVEWIYTNEKNEKIRQKITVDDEDPLRIPMEYEFGFFE